MKLLIASDIHGSAYWCGRLCEEIEKENPDKVILLGDLLYHGPRNDLPRDYAPKKVIPMLSAMAERIIAVRGNCEAEVDQMVLPLSGRLCGAAGRRQDLLSDPRPPSEPGEPASPAQGLPVSLRPHPCEAGQGGRRHPVPESRQRVHPQGREPQLPAL